LGFQRVHATQSSIDCHLTVLAAKTCQAAGFEPPSAGVVPHQARVGGPHAGRTVLREGGWEPTRDETLREANGALSGGGSYSPPP
jgi:hypothetical protein